MVLVCMSLTSGTSDCFKTPQFFFSSMCSVVKDGVDDEGGHLQLTSTHDGECGYPLLLFH